MKQKIIDYVEDYGRTRLVVAVVSTIILSAIGFYFIDNLTDILTMLGGSRDVFDSLYSFEEKIDFAFNIIILIGVLLVMDITLRIIKFSQFLINQVDKIFFKKKGETE